MYYLTRPSTSSMLSRTRKRRKRLTPRTRLNSLFIRARKFFPKTATNSQSPTRTTFSRRLTLLKRLSRAKTLTTSRQRRKSLLSPSTRFPRSFTSRLPLRLSRLTEPRELRQAPTARATTAITRLITPTLRTAINN